jgi:hypothetical protein
VTVQKVTLGRERLVTWAVSMWRWLQTGQQLSNELEDYSSRWKKEMQRGAVRAHTGGCSYACRARRAVAPCR